MAHRIAKYNIVTGFVLLCFLQNTHANQPFNISQLDTIVQRIYNFEFDAARALTYDLGIDETHKVLPFAYSFYWEYLSGNEPEFNLKQCNNYIQNKQLPASDDSLQNVYRVSVDLLQLRVYISNSNYLAPLLLFDDIKHFFNNYEPVPNDNFNMLYWGLYNYYITFAREQTFAARYLLNGWPESSKQSGIIMLENIKNSPSVFVRTEARYYLMRIYFEGEKDLDKALHIAQKLVSDYPGNYIYKWFYLRILKSGDNTEQMNKLRHIFINELLHSGFYSIQQKSYLKQLLMDV